MCSREKGEAPGRLHKATKKRRVQNAIKISRSSSSVTDPLAGLLVFEGGNRPSLANETSQDIQGITTIAITTVSNSMRSRFALNCVFGGSESLHQAFKTSRIWGKWVFPKIMVPPNHPLKNRVFHYFHHPFWGKHPYFRKHPSDIFLFHKKLKAHQNGTPLQTKTAELCKPKRILHKLLCV